MSALAEALEAAQSRAVAVLAKQYVGGLIDRDAVCLALEEIGLHDHSDRLRWLNSLDVIRKGGGEAPAETNGKKDEPITDRQKEFLTKLVHEKQVPYPDKALTKAQASEAIKDLQNVTYDPDKWTVPF